MWLVFLGRLTLLIQVDLSPAAFSRRCVWITKARREDEVTCLPADEPGAGVWAPVAGVSSALQIEQQRRQPGHLSRV